MFVILAITLAVAVIAGLATGGRLANLAWVRLRLLPVLYLALAFGLLPLLVGVPSGLNRTLLTASYILVAIWLGANLRARRGALRSGFIVLMAGWLLNTLPIATNGGMPLSLWAYERAGLTEVPTPGEGGFFKIVIADQDSRLRFLGDVIPMRPITQVVSVGDIFLVLGIGIVVGGGMRAPGEVTRWPRGEKPPASA